MALILVLALKCCSGYTTRTHAHRQVLRSQGLVGFHWCPELCSSIDSRSTKLFLDPEQLQSRNRHCRCFSEYRLRNVNITRFGNASHIFSNYRELPRNCCTTAYLVVFGQALRTAGSSCLDLTLKPIHGEDVTSEDIQKYLMCTLRG